MKKIQVTLPDRPTTKHQWEYQEVCEQLQPIYGKGVWTIPYMKGVTEYKLREAAKIAKQRGIYKLAYLIGIIKKLP